MTNNKTILERLKKLEETVKTENEAKDKTFVEIYKDIAALRVKIVNNLKRIEALEEEIRILKEECKKKTIKVNKCQMLGGDVE